MTRALRVEKTARQKINMPRRMRRGIKPSAESNAPMKSIGALLMASH